MENRVFAHGIKAKVGLFVKINPARRGLYINGITKHSIGIIEEINYRNTMCFVRWLDTSLPRIEYMCGGNCDLILSIDHNLNVIDNIEKNLDLLARKL